MSHTEPPVASLAVKCVGCGYDLSGSAVGGACPECGMEVSKSLILPEDAKLTNNNSSSATMCLILGLVGISACPLVGIGAIIAYSAAKKDVLSGAAPAKSMGMAKTGMVLGWISIGLTVLSMLGVLALLLI